jgi:hypothetical protein
VESGSEYSTVNTSLPNLITTPTYDEHPPCVGTIQLQLFHHLIATSRFAAVEPCAELGRGSRDAICVLSAQTEEISWTHFENSMSNKIADFEFLLDSPLDKLARSDF